MAVCGHKKGGGCGCSAPTSVAVKAHSRGTGRRKKKRAPRKATRPYWTVTSDRGGSCGHQHRTLSGATSCAKKQRAADRARRARLTRKQAKATKAPVWGVERVTP